MHPSAKENGAVSARLDGVLTTHEKSPQDVLGDVTRTDLPRNVVLAAGITFGLMAVLTLGPYFYHRIAPKGEKASEPAVSETLAQPAAPAKAETPREKAKTADLLAPPADPPAPAATTKAAPARDPLLDKLDIGQTKSSDPKKNPLDKTNDDLLKDLK